MKALILAGGYGTRLRPLTYTRPKHLLPVLGRAHIEHVFDLLLAHGITEVVMLTSYLAPAFNKVVGDAVRRRLSVEVIQEGQPLGTAGALKNAEGKVKDGTFIVFNGDILTDADLSAILSFHHARGAEATIALAPVEDPSAYGVVPTDQIGKVIGFIEKPPKEEAPTNFINAGIYVFEPDVLERIPAGRSYSAEYELFPEIVHAGRMYATSIEGYWMDVGTPQKYLQANLDALEGRFSSPAAPQILDGCLLGEGARVMEGAQVSCSCLGAGAVIRPGAVVERSVLLPRTVVAEGAYVCGSVLGESVSIGPGARVENEVLGDNEIVEI